MLNPDKLKQLFPGRVVLKALARDNGFPRIPQYIVEFYIANYIKHNEHLQQNIAEAREYLIKLFPSPERRDEMLSLVTPTMDIMIVDHAKVKFDVKTQQMIATFNHLGTSAHLHQLWGRHFPRLLRDGVWGMYRLGCSPIKNDSKHGYRLEVVEIEPYQTGKIDLKDYVNARKHISDQDWVDLLLSSVGYEPSLLTAREKVLLILRLVPAVESNVNMLELGPRQTGKTYLLRNLSSSVYTASGSNVSAAELFVNLSSGQTGVLGTYRVVQLDEIAHTKFDDISTISMLKDFMESGQYTRGGRTFATDASILLAGNLDVEGNAPSSQYKHLFEPLPVHLQDTAFLDRLHAYVPGWEIGKIRYESISRGYGLVVDYVGQMFMQLRNLDRRKELHKLDIPADLTKRDIVALEKITSGLIKLVYPHDQYTLTQLAELANIALEMRLRVNNEMAKIAPGEFRVKDCKFTAPEIRIGSGSLKEQKEFLHKQRKKIEALGDKVQEAVDNCEVKYKALSMEHRNAVDAWIKQSAEYQALETRMNNLCLERMDIESEALEVSNAKVRDDQNTQKLIILVNRIDQVHSTWYYLWLQLVKMKEEQIDARTNINKERDKVLESWKNGNNANAERRI